MTDSKIIYTHTDEAPLLATYSFLPVIQAYASTAGVAVETRDISLAGRIIASFPERLTAEQYEVTQKGGTERAFTGAYVNTKDPGTYRCIVCDSVLFHSDTKYDSGSGWADWYGVSKGASGSVVLMAEYDRNTGVRPDLAGEVVREPGEGPTEDTPVETTTITRGYFGSDPDAPRTGSRYRCSCRCCPPSTSRSASAKRCPTATRSFLVSSSTGSGGGSPTTSTAPTRAMSVTAGTASWSGCRSRRSTTGALT